MDLMANDIILNWENSMTIFYYKRTGVIAEYQIGVNSMATFGKHKQEYELIMDFVVLEKDDFFLTHSRDFKIDIQTKELIYLLHISKYKTI